MLVQPERSTLLSREEREAHRRAFWSRGVQAGCSSSAVALSRADRILCWPFLTAYLSLGDTATRVSKRSESTFKHLLKIATPQGQCSFYHVPNAETGVLND